MTNLNEKYEHALSTPHDVRPSPNLCPLCGHLVADDDALAVKDPYGFIWHGECYEEEKGVGTFNAYETKCCLCGEYHSEKGIGSCG